MSNTWRRWRHLNSKMLVSRSLKRKQISICQTSSLLKLLPWKRWSSRLWILTFSKLLRNTRNSLMRGMRRWISSRSRYLVCRAKQLVSVSTLALFRIPVLTIRFKPKRSAIWEQTYAPRTNLSMSLRWSSQRWTRSSRRTRSSMKSSESWEKRWSKTWSNTKPRWNRSRRRQHAPKSWTSKFLRWRSASKAWLKSTMSTSRI